LVIEFTGKVQQEFMESAAQPAHRKIIGGGGGTRLAQRREAFFPAWRRREYTFRPARRRNSVAEVDL